jgi:uncharacterized protein YqiB (DUF1249 family)
VKKISITFLFLILFASQAFADFFQFVYKEGKNEWYVSVSTVIVYDNNNKKLFSGNTDRYGRLKISLAKGTYRCVITYNQKTYTTNLTIDQSNNLKKIAVPQLVSVRRY